MLAYHNNKGIKEHYLARVRAHRAADELVKGQYWEQYRNSTNPAWRGCAVGCTIHGSNHEAYEDELGIPRILARLEDGIFESLPEPDYLNWPEQFLSAVPVGADLALVWPRFAVWLLTDERDGVIRFAKSGQSRDAIQRVGSLYARVVAGETVGLEEFIAAAYAADAADADADAAAADAADAADADADADAYDAYAAKQKARQAQAEKLLELLAAAPVPELVTA